MANLNRNLRHTHSHGMEINVSHVLIERAFRKIYWSDRLFIPTAIGHPLPIPSAKWLPSCSRPLQTCASRRPSNSIDIVPVNSVDDPLVSIPMSTDIAWQPQQRDSGNDMEDAHAQSAQQQQPPTQHVQEWDPSAFLNPSMFSSDLLSGSPATTTPTHTQNHFQQDQPQLHRHQPQQHNLPQLMHPLTQQPPFPQESFQDSYINDSYNQSSFDMYHQSDISRHSFESSRYRPSPVQQASDLSPSMAQLGLHQDYLYSATNPFQQQQSQQQNQQQASLPQNLQGHPFDFRQSPTITPNDRASPHPRASPFTISPVSNHSFAQLQDFPGGPDRRPSTADSVHSLHGEYPSATDFSMGAGILNGTDLGRSLNGIPGVVPSAIHQFSQRNGTANTSSYHPHLTQEPSPMGLNYGNVLSQPPSSASGPPSSQSSAPPAFISQTQPYPNHQASQYAPEQNFHVAPHALDSDGPVAYASVTGNTPEMANYLRYVCHKRSLCPALCSGPLTRYPLVLLACGASHFTWP